MKGSFSDVIAEWVESVQVALDEVFQMTVIKVSENVIRLSPVDSGHFKGNWQLSRNGESTTELEITDISGSSTLAKIQSKANSLTAGQFAYILNHVPYGADLEEGLYRGPTAKVTADGFSRQAPAGMVRVTASMFLEIVDEAVAVHKVK